MFRLSLLAVLLSLSIAGHADAQQRSSPVRAGDQVRVRAATVTGVFTVVGVDDQGMTLQAAPMQPVIEVPHSSVSRLHVNRGQRSYGAGLMRGAGWGLLVGGAVGVVGGYADGDDLAGWFSLTKEEKAVMLGVLFGGAGAVTGGMAGLISPGQRWERVASTTGLHVAPRTDGVAVALSHRF